MDCKGNDGAVYSYLNKIIILTLLINSINIHVLDTNKYQG
jgi:hypothetical protein